MSENCLLYTSALTSRGATEKEKRQSLLLAAACAKGAK